MKNISKFILIIIIFLSQFVWCNYIPQPMQSPSALPAIQKFKYVEEGFLENTKIKTSNNEKIRKQRADKQAKDLEQARAKYSQSFMPKDPKKNNDKDKHPHVYPGNFFDADDQNFLSYDQWIKNYEPALTIEIPKNIAKKWLGQTDGIFKQIDANIERCREEGKF